VSVFRRFGRATPASSIAPTRAAGRPSALEGLLAACARLWPVEYRTYIRSDLWRRRATAAKRRAGWRCQVCAAREAVLDAHHNDYRRLGWEHPRDLVVLCRKCHRIFHGRIREHGNQD
jgi:hypothetical protein